MRRAIAVLVAVALAGAALAGCTTPTPPSPVAAIPKLTVDFQDNETRIYITSINADVRYGNISISLHNANLTENLTFNESKSFAIVASTNLTFFTMNTSADEGTTDYYYNTTLHIGQKPATSPTDPVVWQIYIRDTPDGPIRTEALPFRHTLAAR